jgi:hypothetical protein
VTGAEGVRIEDMADAPGPAEAGAPRRQERAQTVSLISISTDALSYDFVRAREEGHGLTNVQIGNSVQSDLLRGLQLRFAHDLWHIPPAAPDDPTAVAGTRVFSPRLSEVNASFSLSSDSWLFRMLGLGRGVAPSSTGVSTQGGDPLQDREPNVGGPAVDMTHSEFGMVGTSRRTMVGEPRGAAGAWNASLNYTMSRQRNAPPGQRDNQMVRGNVNFQPTENWTVRWSTAYAFAGTGFADHILTLSRRLHDWDANFDFLKAQNGNFSFQFRVHLRANPDIKVDYSQSDSPNLRREQGF